MITTDNSQTLANALAEIKRLEDEVQRQRERHRTTWTQLEQAQRENDQLRSCLADARYRIEQGRVWSGMGWTLTGLSANGQQKALDAIDAAPPKAALSQQAEPNESELEALGLGYPFSKEDAVKLWYKGFRTEPIALLEVWEAIGHDVGIDPSKHELMDSLRNMEAICRSHGYDFPSPAEPAPAQDELRKRFDEIEDEVARGKHTAASVFTQMRTAAMYIRPAQTEQQPVAEVAWPDEPGRRGGFSQLGHYDTPRLPVGTKLYAAPIAQTAPQPVDRDLIASEVKHAYYERKTISEAVDAICALSATPSPAMDAKEE